MATANYTGSQILDSLFGRIDTLTTPTRAVFRLAGSGFHRIITGTDASFTNLTAGGAGPFLISVDGGAYTTPTLSAGTLPIFSGLSDGPHTVDCLLLSAYAGGGTYFTLASNSLSVTGASPSIAVNPNYKFQLLALGAPKVASKLLSDPSTYNQLYGPGLGSSAYYSVPPLGAVGGFSGIGMSFVATDVDRIYVVTNTTSKWFALEKDGVRQPGAVLTSISSSQMQPVLLASGLSDGATHEWTVIPGGNAGGGQVFDGVIVGGANAVQSSTLPTVRQAIMCLGDSNTAGSDGGGAGTTGGDATLSWGYNLARLLGKDAIIQGRAGTLTITGAQQVVNDFRSAFQTGFVPTHLVIMYGRNNSDTVTTQADYITLLNNALSVPQFTGKIIACTLPAPFGTSGTGVLVNTGLRNAVTAVNSSRVPLCELSGITAGTGTDNTHWSIAGHAAIAAAIQASGLLVDAVTSIYPAPFIEG